MLHQPKKEKLLKNARNKHCYLFNWTEGGYNHVWASNLKEFKEIIAESKEAMKHAKVKVLNVNYNTLHKATPTQYKNWVNQLWD